MKANDLSLFERDIVFLNDNHTESFTDTLAVAEKLEMKHKKVLQVTEMLMKKGHIGGSDIRPSSYTSKQNKQIKKYDLTEKGTVRLIMSTNSSISEQVKTEFVNSFHDMGSFLSSNDEWQESRYKLKALTKTGNNAIQLFLNYAKANESENYERYYTIFQRQINQVVLGVSSYKRDNIPKEHLAIIIRLEDVLYERLSTLMLEEVDYHEISTQTLSAIREIGYKLMKDTNLIELKELSPKQGCLNYE